MHVYRHLRFELAHHNCITKPRPDHLCHPNQGSTQNLSDLHNRTSDIWRYRESQGLRKTEFWKTSCECRLEQSYQNLFCFLLLCLLCIFSCLYSVLFLFVSVPLVDWFIYLFSFYILVFVWIHPVFVLFSNILEFNYFNCSLFTTTPSLLITS